MSYSTRNKKRTNMVLCHGCNMQIPLQSTYAMRRKMEHVMCNNCRQQSELKKRLVCVICNAQLTPEQITACGIPSDKINKYLNYRCYRSSIDDYSFVSEYFGVLLCPNHICSCAPRSQPNRNVKACDICKNKMVCRECEYRRCKNGILYVSVCKICYDS